MSRRVFVTGASGFVGRRLSAALLDAGWSVRAGVRGARPVPGAEVVDWRLPDRPTRTALSGVDAVVHLAAFRPPNLEDPSFARQCLEDNAVGTLELLLAAADAGVSHAVYVSAGNVYSTGDQVTEDAPIYPSGHATYYLASKLCGEIWASHLHESGALSVASLRPTAIYGPGGPGVVPLFIDRLRAGLPITLRDGGLYAADLVFVDDVVAAVLAALDGRATGTYNIGSGRTTSILELASRVSALTGSPPELVVVEPGDGATSGFPAVDIARAVRDLAYTPTPLDEGLRRMLA